MRKKQIILIVVVIAAILMVSAVAAAVNEFSMAKFTIAAGGYSDSGEFGLDGVIGQADAGVSAGGEFALGGGYFGDPGAEVGIPDQGYSLFLPFVTK